MALIRKKDFMDNKNIIQIESDYTKVIHLNVNGTKHKPKFDEKKMRKRRAIEIKRWL